MDTLRSLEGLLLVVVRRSSAAGRALHALRHAVQRAPSLRRRHGRIVHTIMHLLLLCGVAACASKPWLEQVEPAALYTTDSTGRAVPFAAGRAESVLLAQAAKYQLQLQGDGRLAVLADLVLDHFATQGALPDSRNIDAMARRLGITDELSSMGFFDADDLEAGAAQMFRNLPRNIRFNRFGIAKFQAGRSFSFGVILSARLVQLQPVPRRVNAMTTLQIAGRLLPPGRTAIGYVTSPSGTAQMRGQMSGADFAFAVRLTTPGVYRIEIMSDAGQGPAIAAILPIHVGVGEEVQLAAGSTEATDLIATAPTEAIVARVLERLNQARVAAGAAALPLDPSLTRLALGHSQDMVDHDFFAHVSPMLGDPFQRAVNAQLPLQWTGENIALAPSAESAHQGLMDSPGHRMNMLNADHNRVGIGVVRGKSRGSGLYVSVEFGYALPPLEEAAKQALAVLNEARADAGQALLALQPGWSKALQPLLHRCLDADPPGGRIRVDQIPAALNILPLQPPLPNGYRVLLVSLGQLLGKAPVPPKLGGQMERIGMAFALGTPDGAKGKSPYALLLVAPANAGDALAATLDGAGGR